MCRVSADADGLRTSLPHPEGLRHALPRLHLLPPDSDPDPPRPRRGPHLRLLPGVRVEGLVQGGRRRPAGQGPLAGQRTPLLSRPVPRLVPATVLGRTRLAAAAVAVALLLGDFVVTYLSRRALFLEPLLVAPAIVLGGVGLGDPMATVGLCMCALVIQSLYGSQQAAATRILTVAAAFPVTIALSPTSLGGHIAWQSGAVLGLLPMIAMMGVLTRALYASLVRHEAAAARETLLARTGSRLLNRTDAREVRLITHEAAAELCGLLPGVGVLVLRRAGEEVIVEGSAGVPETVRGTVLAPSCVDGLDPRDSDRAQELSCSTERSTGWPAAGAAGGRSGWPPPTPTGSCSPAPCGRSRRHLRRVPDPGHPLVPGPRQLPCPHRAGPPGPPRPADRAPQPDAVLPAAGRRLRRRHRRRRGHHRPADRRPRRLQAGQRRPRPHHRGRAAGRGGRPPGRGGGRPRDGGALRRRRV